MTIAAVIDGTARPITAPVPTLVLPLLLVIKIPDYSPVSICNPAHLAGLRLGTYIIGFPNFQTLVPGDESWWIRTV
jgi:hypothetical protein